MRYVEELESCHDYLKDASAQVVGQQHVRVELEQLRDESLEHLSFGLKYLDRAIVLLLELLLQVKRPWLFVKLPHDAELIQLGRVRRSVLIQITQRETTDHGYLIGVVV